MTGIGAISLKVAMIKTEEATGMEIVEAPTGIAALEAWVAEWVTHASVFSTGSNKQSIRTGDL